MRIRRRKLVYNEDGYAGDSDDSSSDDGSMASYEDLPQGDGPFDKKTNDDYNMDIDGHNDQDDPDESNSDDIFEFLTGAHMEDDYYGLSDIDIGHDEEKSEAMDREKSYPEKETRDVASEYDGKSDLDIGLDKEKTADNYWKVMGMTFETEPAAYVWYNSYAKDRGFSVRRERAKKGKGPLGQVRLKRYVCSRSGRRESKYFNMEGRVRRPRPESRCDCKAQFVVTRDRKLDGWVVSRFDDHHNHILARPDEVVFLRSHRKILDHQKAEIRALVAAGVRKNIIMRTFISRYGRYCRVGFISRDLYNLCSREKRMLLENGDANTVIGIMVTRKQKDPDFFFEYKVDIKGRLNCMFWCDSQSRQDYQDYGDVVVFDSTYKMNRYCMPFIPFVGLNNHRKTTVFGCAIVSDEKVPTYVWLLETFLKAMCQKKPKSVITDGDAAMIKAIRIVLPGVWHRLCGWHVDNNMQKHLNNKSLKEFRSLLYYATSVDVFERRWNAFVRKWQTDRTEKWLTRMYKKKRLWAASYLADGFFLGMRSNQRSESLNSCLHLHLDSGMTLVDLVLHSENAVVRIRENEAEDNCVCS